MLFLGILASGTPCSEQDRTANLTECLDEITSAYFDDSLFWFGTQYPTLCPNGPASGFECINHDPTATDSIATRLFDSMDYAPKLDRYLMMTYESIDSKGLSF